MKNYKKREKIFSLVLLAILLSSFSLSQYEGSIITVFDNLGYSENTNENINEKKILGSNIDSSKKIMIENAADAIYYGPDDHYSSSDVLITPDVNGDGISDLLITDPQSATSQLGRTYLMYGGFNNEALLGTRDIEDISNVTFRGSSSEGRTPTSIATGDVNGDGIYDIIFSTYHSSFNPTGSGEINIIYGSSSFLTAEDILFDNKIFSIHNRANVTIYSNNSYDDFGLNIIADGDLDGDGFDDLIIGAQKTSNGEVTTGALYIYYGRSEWDEQYGSLDADCVLFGDDEFNNVGYSMSNYGDFNGDGLDDLLIADGSMFDEQTYTNYAKAKVILGNEIRFESKILTEYESASITGSVGFGRFSISSIGDINGDGYDDFGILNSENKMVYYFYGEEVITATSDTDADFTISYTNDLNSVSLSKFDDINNDGYDEICVGTTHGIYIFRGSNDVYGNYKHEDADIKYLLSEIEPFYCEFSTNGDLNNDGYNDLIVSSLSAEITMENQGATFIFLNTTESYTEYVLGDFELNPIDQMQFVGESSSDDAGFSVTLLKDFNGDGIGDIAIGAPLEGGSYEGAVYVIYGSDDATPNSYDLENADIKFYGALSYEYSGHSIADAGDVNRDGYSDLLIGAYGYNNGTDTDAGRVYLLYGSSTWESLVDLDKANATFVGAGQDHYLGGGLQGVSSAGDVNNDGYSDILLGSYGAGRAYLINGGSSVEGTYDMSDSADYTARFYGYSSSYELGYSVSSAGDINNDGYDDILISEPNEGSGRGSVYIWYGSLSLAGDYDIGSGPAYDEQFYGETTGDEIGTSISSAGDVNHDGFADMLIGAPNEGTGGSAYLIYGSDSLSDGDISARADVKFTGSANAGCSVSSAGDFNNDGYDDIIIGNYQVNTLDGAVYVIYGKSEFLTNSISLTSAADVTYSGISGDNGWTGYSVAGGADLNGDGRDDIIIGTPESDLGGSSAGASYVVFGESSITAPFGYHDLAWSDASYVGDQSTDSLGRSISSAGDINGDGFDDFLISDYSGGCTYLIYGSEKNEMIDRDLDPSEFADVIFSGTSPSSYVSVCSAGDFDGDGYDDILIASPDEDTTEYTRGGLVYLIYGRDDLRSDYDLDLFSPVTFEGTYDNNYAGYCVTGGKDINGDGLDDIIIGSFGQSNNGTVYVVYGTKYLLGTRSLKTANIIITGENVGDRFGEELELIEDFNGDNYADIAIAAKQNTEDSGTQGATYFIYGSNSLPNEMNISDSYDAKIIGEASSNYLGTALTSNDINGDGLSDLTISAPECTEGTNVEGKVYTFLGGYNMSGIIDAVDANITFSDFRGTFGVGLSSVGDINNDGYEDLAIGNYQNSIGGLLNGITYLYYGCDSINGTYTTNHANASFIGEGAGGLSGYSISKAGDYNHDGFEDFMISAYNYPGGEYGKVYLILGGSMCEQSLSNLRITPDPIQRNEDIEALFDGEENMLWYEIKWYEDVSFYHSEFYNYSIIPSAESSLNYETCWHFEVNYIDIWNRNQTQKSDYVYVMNIDPIIGNITLTPGQPLNGSDITVTWDGYDPDGTTVNSLVHWYQNGELRSDLDEFIPSGNPKTATLSNLETYESDLWYAQVEILDGLGASNIKRSGAVYVLPRTDPIISGPEDLSFELQEAREGGTLVWNVYDPVSNYTSRYYSILEVFESGGTLPKVMNQTWSNSQPIIYDYVVSTTSSVGFRLEVSDGYDGFSTDTVNVNCWNDAPVISEYAEDIYYSVNSTPNILSWTASDDSVSTRKYYIERNSTLIVDGEDWSNDEAILYLPSGLEPGDYNFTIYISDEFGQVTEDSVWVHVMNSVPILTTPDDVEFEITNDNTGISWTLIDSTSLLNSMHYNLTQNGQLISEKVPWTSEDVVDLDLSSLSVGVYTYVITLSDGFNGTISDSVQVTVTNDNPFVSNPSDISFQVDSIGHTVTWSILDDSIKTGSQTYSISRNGTIILDDKSWISGDTITLDLNELDAGNYIFEIAFEDGYGGIITDSVIVVVESIESSSGSMSIGLGIALLIIGLAVGITGGIFLSKSLKKNNDVTRDEASKVIESVQKESKSEIKKQSEK